MIGSQHSRYSHYADFMPESIFLRRLDALRAIIILTIFVFCLPLNGKRAESGVEWRWHRLLFMNRWPMHDSKYIIKGINGTHTKGTRTKDSSSKLSTRNLRKAWMKAHDALAAKAQHRESFPNALFPATKASQLRLDSGESLAAYTMWFIVYIKANRFLGAKSSPSLNLENED